MLPKVGVAGRKGLVQRIIVAIKFFKGLGLERLPGVCVGAQGAGQGFSYGRQLLIGLDLGGGFAGLGQFLRNFFAVAAYSAGRYG